MNGARSCIGASLLRCASTTIVLSTSSCDQVSITKTATTDAVPNATNDPRQFGSAKANLNAGSAAEAPDLDAAPEIVRVELRAQIVDGRFSYNGLHPGPTIRANFGDRVIVDFVNELTEPTTIHWHGLNVPYEMDGASFPDTPVPAGGSFRYEFTVNQAGTFWYHPHFHPDEHHDAGMVGAFVVSEPPASTVPADEELTLVFQAKETRSAHTTVMDGDHGTGVIERLLPEWRVNDALLPQIRMGSGTVVRVRAINASAREYLVLRWPQMYQIASDQGLWPSTATPDRVVLAPSDRAEFLVAVGAEDFVIQTDAYSPFGGDLGGEPVDLATVITEGDAPAPAMPALVLPTGAQTSDPGYADFFLVITGSDRSNEWYFNGKQFPEVVSPELARFSRPIVELRNISDTEHPFHVHGMTFEVLSINDQPPPRQTIEDTINVRIRDRVRVQLHPDNPGAWMAHCHILDHISEGLMTIFRVQ